MIDLCAFAQFEITCRDAGKLLDRLSANRIPQKDGRISLNHLLTERGKFEAEITIWRIADDRYFTGSAIARANPDFDWIQSHIQPGEDVQMNNRSNDWGMLALSGPASRRILSKMTETDLSNASFPWLSGKEGVVAGVQCHALRVSFVGELGWELHAPLDQIGDLYDALHTAGEPHGLTGIGSYALNGMRMENAYRASGKLTTDVGPFDVGLERFVISDGRDFVGKDALLQRIPGWQLFYAELHADDVDIHGGEPVVFNSAPVGLTTSGGFGYTIGKSLGWLFVRNGTPTEDLSVQILNREIPVTVHPEALFDPQNLRPLSEE